MYLINLSVFDILIAASGASKQDQEDGNTHGLAPLTATSAG
jgi:hypothetical protein